MLGPFPELSVAWSIPIVVCCLVHFQSCLLLGPFPELSVADGSEETVGRRNKSGTASFHSYHLSLKFGWQVRTMSCILLRRMFASNFEEVWPQLPAELQTGVKQELMAAIKDEGLPAIRKKACDAIAELARNMLGTWHTCFHLGAAVDWLLNIGDLSECHFVF